MRALELAVEAIERAAVDLRDARLGHAEDLADLLQQELLAVVQRDDGLLRLGQRADRRDEERLHLVPLGAADRVLAAWIAKQRAELFRGSALERRPRGDARRLQDLVDLLDGRAE